MFLVFDDRPSDSPFVERVWRSRSERAGTFVTVASPHWEMVVTRHAGKTFLTVRGPETRATRADCPANGEWLGVRFKLGTFMPQLPVAGLCDRRDVNLPDVSGRSFWLDGVPWEYPGYESAEQFVKRLVNGGLIAADPHATAVARGEPTGASRRTGQRHFRHATSLSPTTARQIDRARHAARLLRDGTDIADAVHLAGYFDQSHLARSFRRLIGLTPAQIQRGSEQLSFLYKTG